jgi:formiminotetrahydrofolate cyclodeaminase
VTDTPTALDDVAGQLATASPVEGAGVLAAGVVGLAAGLCESVARATLAAWEQAGGTAIQAAALRVRAGEASVANARAYASARAALAADPGSGATGRDAMLRASLLRAADTLLTIADTGADCAGLAAEIAAHCLPGLRPDAAGAAELAASAVRTAAGLVQANLALLPGDERRQRAAAIVLAAEAQRGLAREAAALA